MNTRPPAGEPASTKTILGLGLCALLTLTLRAQLSPAPAQKAAESSTKPVLTLRGHGADGHAVAFSPDGKRLASASQDRAAKVWDATSGKEVLTIIGHLNGVWGVTFSPDGRRLATAGRDQIVKVWDTTTGRELLALRGFGCEVYRTAFSPDGKRLATAGGLLSRPSEVKLWDTSSGKELLVLRGHTNLIPGVAFSPDGQRIASASLDQSVRVWDANTGRELQVLTGHATHVYAVAFSADGRRLASAGGNFQSRDAARKPGEIRVWDVLTGRETRTLKAPNHDLFDLSFSPDGRYLAAAGGLHAAANQPGQVQVWDVASGRQVLSLPGHGGAVYGVAFSPDGRRLASTGKDKTVLVWDVSGRFADGRPPVAKLTPAELEALGADLAANDAARAYRAVWALAGVPHQAVPFLKQRLRPVGPLDEERLARLIADLDDERYSVRRNASQELEKYQDLARPALLKALASKPTVEVCRRVDQLLERLDGPVTAPEQLAGLRAVEVLEHVGTAEARRVLEEVAEGMPGARLTREARDALNRLAKRPQRP